MGRAPCCDKANVKRGPWSPEEDAKLKSYIEQNGTGGNWIALPQKIGLKRCGKSCRLRWLNYLRPNIRHGGFSEEEDNIICSLYTNIGSRWSIIAAQLPGRTDNDIKNYWNTRLKKKLLGKQPKQPPPRPATLRRETTHSLTNMNQQHIAEYLPEFPFSTPAPAPTIFEAQDNTNNSDQIATYGMSLSSMSSGDTNYAVDSMVGSLPFEMVYGHPDSCGINGVSSVQSSSWGYVNTLDYLRLLSEFENCLPQQYSSSEVSSYLPHAASASGKWLSTI